uniref:Uncharacterized protein n=1 Tax=Ananas comosus var. bracteatus TaxID=296719 RepID=A0A6V7NYJ0_ANACO|nr:unnamed protein product [Ananas comosus var. bracteatus]
MYLLPSPMNNGVYPGAIFGTSSVFGNRFWETYSRRFVAVVVHLYISRSLLSLLLYYSYPSFRLFSVTGEYLSPSSACGTHWKRRHVYIFSPPTPITGDVAGPSRDGS